MSKWKAVNVDGKPTKDGLYIVNSSWGVRAAYFMKQFGNCFQDTMTNQDEGMPDWSQIFQNDFHVTHWMELPKAPKMNPVCEHKNTHYSQRWGEHVCSDCGDSVQCVGINGTPIGIENW